MGGYFSDDSMLRRIHRERAVALSGPRALLMRAAHPLAVSGLLAHSTAMDEPYDRLARTAEVMSTIGFGERADADRVTRHVRAMHRRVQGKIRNQTGSFPAGTPYRADQPDLLMWVLFTLVDSGLVVYRMYVGGLDEDERAAYWDDYKVVGRLFGLRLRDMPDTLADLDDYRREMLEGDRLVVTDWARTRAREIVFEPPLPLAARPLLEMANFITVGLLPERIRDLYRFSWDPARGLALGAGQQYTRRLLVPFLPSFVRHVPRARGAAA